MPEDVYLSWVFDPVLLGGLLTVGVLFALAAGPLRRTLAPGRPRPLAAAAGVYGALFLTYLLEASPLHDLADTYSLTAHMVQHLGVSYLVAPLLLWSVPPWMLRPLLLNRFVAPVARLLTRPFVALGAFSLSFTVWHVPVVYDAAIRNETLHHLTHVGFLLTSLIVWWPIMSRLNDLPRPSYSLRLLYLFLIPIALLPVSSFITFAGQPIYDTYAASPWTLGMDVVSEQALAGVVMKATTFVAFVVPLLIVFGRWLREASPPSTVRLQGTPGRSGDAGPSPSSATSQVHGGASGAPPAAR